MKKSLLVIILITLIRLVSLPLSYYLGYQNGYNQGRNDGFTAGYTDGNDYGTAQEKEDLANWMRNKCQSSLFGGYYSIYIVPTSDGSVLFAC